LIVRMVLAALAVPGYKVPDKIKIGELYLPATN
jgi:hypothetical protein